MPEIRITPEPELPTTVYGFAIEQVIGPYPIGSASHRRAIYTKARPSTIELAEKLHRAGGHALIIGTSPITCRSKAEFDRLPDDDRESLCLQALRPVARLARKVANA